MSITAILVAIGALGALSLVFGLLLMSANKAFEVPANPQQEAIRNLLPGANCGGCGYAGCDALAQAIAEGKAAVNACPVGGNATAEGIAAVMGLEAPEQQVRTVATVLCQGSHSNCKEKFRYIGIQDCAAAALVNDGNRSCRFACLGFGTCVAACKFDALSINAVTGIAEVDAERCQGCGACIDVCPKEVLQLLPEKQPIRLLCRAADKGYLVGDNCKIGCIGCEACKAACKFDAITIVNHLPVIDYSKCVGCMMCAETCPTEALWGDYDNRKIAKINRDLCIGCTLCKKVCKFDAISGELKQVHEVSKACTGCGECAKKCPKKAITLNVRKHVRDANAKASVNEVNHMIP